MNDFEATIHLRSEQSAGEISIIELNLAPGWDGPPLHHHDFDEAFYVVEGELTFWFGDELVTRGPGSLTFAPRGAHHTMTNLSDAPVRYLLTCTPAGFERRFEHTDLPKPEVHFVGPTIRGRTSTP